MKDLEKIKSEDLAAQVQDANPANFAIEQEVAQLVGATVPQPTEPSADDARELGAQLLVFLRRALLPIRSALRTAVAAIYAHLDSRCTDYTPAGYAPFTPTHHAYDPMGSTPRTLPNLLTALTAFDSRKISNGNGGTIADGISLAHLMFESMPANAVTEIDDDNSDWTYDKAGLIGTICNVFPNVGKITLRCKRVTANLATSFSTSRRLELHLLDAISLPTADTSFFDCYITDATQFYLYCYALSEFYSPITNNTWCSAREVYLYNFAVGRWKIGFHRSYVLMPTRKIYFGCKGKRTDLIALYSTTVNLTNLEDIEFGEGARQPFILRLTESSDASSIRPTGMTRETIREHIIDRLADNRFEDDGVTPAPAITISLGSLEIAKLTAEDIAVATNKNYTLA